jgi:flagellar protein FliS
LDPDDTADVGIQGAAAGASPPRLILMLCDGALTAMGAARAAQARGQVAARRAALSKAIAIVVQGLRPAVRQDAGGGLGASLVALYDYIANRLRYAGLNGDAASIDEAARLLADLRGAWEAWEHRSRSNAARAPEKRKPARGAAPGHART